VFKSKRTLDLGVGEVQEGNRSWWNDNPMTYDWHAELQAPKYSRAWFDAIDRSFLSAARYFATDSIPFDRLIPFEQLRGKRILEIGCGMGLHTELLATAGAELTSLDLTDTAIEATTRRLELKGLKARILKGDAENLPFDDRSFDFVWSWGVIHHSSRTGRIVRQIARVLRPDGECRVMVYNREGIPARLAFFRDFLLKGAFLRRRFDEVLFSGTDGFSARYYVREQFEDLFRAFFEDASCEVLGQDSDVLPLPRGMRSRLIDYVPEGYARRVQSSRGGFLFLKARRPV
jgi:SAM-dependent methyltransferase